MGILRDIGAPGLIIIVLGALLIFGPKRLPELGLSSSFLTILSFYDIIHLY